MSEPSTFHAHTNAQKRKVAHVPSSGSHKKTRPKPPSPMHLDNAKPSVPSTMSPPDIRVSDALRRPMMRSHQLVAARMPNCNRCTTRAHHAPSSCRIVAGVRRKTASCRTVMGLCDRCPFRVVKASRGVCLLKEEMGRGSGRGGTSASVRSSARMSAQLWSAVPAMYALFRNVNSVGCRQSTSLYPACRPPHHGISVCGLAAA